MTERQIAMHAEPARRDDANFIVRLDLTEHGMPGKYEQMWTRTSDQRSFDLCRIPFFTYGQSLGDVMEGASTAVTRRRMLRWCGPAPG